MILAFETCYCLSLGTDEAKRKKPCESEEAVRESTNGKRLKTCGESSQENAHMEEGSPTVSPSEISEDLENIKATLESRDLWDRFNELGTEMIITKSGR